MACSSFSSSLPLSFLWRSFLQLGKKSVLTSLQPFPFPLKFFFAEGNGFGSRPRNAFFPTPAHDAAVFFSQIYTICSLRFQSWKSPFSPVNVHFLPCSFFRYRCVSVGQKNKLSFFLLPLFFFLFWEHPNAYAGSSRRGEPLYSALPPCYSTY